MGCFVTLVNGSECAISSTRTPDIDHPFRSDFETNWLDFGVLKFVLYNINI